MPHVTVYVSDDLKARMDAAGKELNWSAVAQEAFSYAALRSIAQQKDATMDDVIERLRASKKRIDDLEHAKGKAAGALWARRTAEFDHLERIAKFEGHVDLDTLLWLIDPERRGGPVLYAQILNVDEGNNPIATDSYASGFAEGAGEIYDEVIDEL